MIVDKLPPRIQYAYWFQAFNAVSWQICLGSPLILFARELGAPAVVLGLLAGLAPLTSVLQLLVAPYAERIGYRRLMVSGWTARVITLMVLVALPLMVDVLSPAVVIAATVGVIFLFTTLRGIAMCAWLPWITAIVPRSLRGFYLSRDRAFISLASVAALAVSGLFLFDHRGMAPYSIVFGLGFLGGVVSLYFLNRIPEPPLLRREQVERTQTRAGAGWGALLRSPGFAQLVLFSATAQVVVLSSGAFVTVFAREEVRLSDGAILWATAASSLVGAVALALLRNRIDALGSRPFLGLVFLWWVAYDALWLALALSPTRSPLLAIATLSIAGFFGSIYDLALTRLLMNTVGDQPETTRYFALHSVIVSLLNGVAPMLWGAVLDWARSVQVGVADLLLNGYSFFFALQGILLIGVFWSLLRVHEPNAASTRQVLRGAIEQAPRELKRRFQLRR